MDAPLSHPARRDRPTDRTHCGLHTLSVVASGRRFGVAGRAVLIAAKARRQWVNDSGFETPLHSHIELAVLDRRPAAPELNPTEVIMRILAPAGRDSSALKRCVICTPVHSKKSILRMRTAFIDCAEANCVLAVSRRA